MPKEAVLYERLEGKKVHCYLCAHQCRIGDSGRGFCKVRENIGGTLFTYSYGKLISQAVDPVEKKPLYHFMPGSKSYSIAAIGCNFRCPFCQNWQISQVDEAEKFGFTSVDMKPQEIVSRAVRQNCRSISYTYTEPTIFFELAYETAQLAQQKDIKNIFVTNGYMTKQTIETIRSFLDAANIDLKSFSDDFYKRHCRARLQPVLDAISCMKEFGIWIEITTLIIPGENDSEQELENIADFIAGIDVNIPWHISRFFPNYHFAEVAATDDTVLERAKKIGSEKGLKYVYPGNTPEIINTYCPGCGQLLINRAPGMIGCSDRFDKGKCISCGSSIAGLW
jgi:pyruvate formate lyase activating enzyme